MADRGSLTTRGVYNPLGRAWRLYAHIVKFVEVAFLFLTTVCY